MRRTTKLPLMLSSLLVIALLGTLALTGRAGAGRKPSPVELEEARIFIEFNFSGNDLGFHVFLDGEDWKSLKIVGPNRRVIFDVQGRGGYRRLGLTELFFEGAEPTLDEVPLEELLAFFPEGEYRFVGRTVDGGSIVGTATLTYAVPDAPDASAQVGANNSLVISWDPVTGPADILPDEEVEIAGYQVIVGSFQVTVPASVTSVTVSPEFVGSLEPGEHDFEVLAIEEGGNQTITEGSFTLP